MMSSGCQGMGEYLTVLGYAAMPALGNFAGGILAEFMRASGKVLSLALHLAAGIVFGVVAIELMPQALASPQPLLILGAFVVGGILFLAVERTSNVAKTRFGGKTSEAGPWAIFLGVAVDLFTDGILVGTGATIDPRLGLLLALGQVPADVPEGFATIATFKNAGVQRKTRILLSMAFAIPVLLGATVGFWALRGQDDLYKLLVLAAAAGLLVTLVVEELVPEMHREGKSRFASPLIAIGFALFGVVSVLF